MQRRLLGISKIFFFHYIFPAFICLYSLHNLVWSEINRQRQVKVGAHSIMSYIPTTSWLCWVSTSSHWCVFHWIWFCKSEEYWNSLHTFAFKKNSLKHNASHRGTEAQKEIIYAFPSSFTDIYIYKNLICNRLLSYGAWLVALCGEKG